MTLQDLELQSAYDSGSSEVSVLKDFYIPCLKEAVSYKRLTGYFSSQVLALAARGIAGLIQNQGKLKLITSPALTEKDFEILKNNNSNIKEKIIDDHFKIVIDNIHLLTSTIAYNHARALAWMLREGFLEIRILIPKSIGPKQGIFHQKVGIVEDSTGNKISFSGSVNETAMGWMQNIEEFKVFKSWEPGQEDWVKHDEKIFDKYWDVSTNEAFETIDLPEASARRIIEIAPEELSDLDLDEDSNKILENTKKIRQYQQDAIDSWSNANYQGIFEMATGTGKTFTALQCVKKWLNDKDKSLILVTCPTQTIGTQWRETLEQFSPITTFGKDSWRDDIKNATSDFLLGVRDQLVVIAIQNTASMDDFIKYMNTAISATNHHLIIADEMHGLGSAVFQKTLNRGFESRLGLTATPTRWFDDEGTKLLLDYFGGIVFTFGLHEALNWIDPDTNLTPLCPYEYKPRFVDLDDEEINQYLELTNKIIYESNRKSEDFNQGKLDQLMFARADILKSAKSKFSEFEKVLNEIGPQKDCLVYCSDNDQLDTITEIAKSKGIIYRKFTGEEGTTPSEKFNGKSEREWILNSFENGEIHMLIAIKCLDEGVDIPSAKTGIILASTTNPREFIQRRGRLLRRAEGKNQASIYDLVVAPIIGRTDQTYNLEAARKIFSKEIQRVEEFGKEALNKDTISYQILTRMLAMSGIE